MAMRIEWELDLAEEFIPLAILLEEKGDQVVVRVQSELLQILNVNAVHDCLKFGLPSHTFRLVLKPTGTCDSVEMQRVSRYKRGVFEALDVRINGTLYPVFLRCEERF